MANYNIDQLVLGDNTYNLIDNSSGYITRASLGDDLEKVRQIPVPNTNNEELRILLSNSSTNSTETNFVNKTSQLTYNASTDILTSNTSDNRFSTLPGNDEYTLHIGQYTDRQDSTWNGIGFGLRNDQTSEYEAVYNRSSIRFLRYDTTNTSTRTRSGVLTCNTLTLNQYRSTDGTISYQNYQAPSFLRVRSVDADGSTTLTQFEVNPPSTRDSVLLNGPSSRYMTTLGTQYIRLYDSGTAGTAPSTSGAINSILYITPIGFYLGNNNTWSQGTDGVTILKDRITLKANSSSATITKAKVDAWDDAKNTVYQVNTATLNDNYRILFSGSANDTTEVAGVRKSTHFYFNPVEETLKVGQISSNGALLLKGNTYQQNIVNESISSRYKSTMGTQYLRFYDSGASGTAPVPDSDGNINNVTTIGSSGYYMADNLSYSASTNGMALTRTALTFKNSSGSYAVNATKITNWDNMVSNGVTKTGTQTLSNKTLEGPTITNSMDFDDGTAATNFRVIRRDSTTASAFTYTMLPGYTYVIFVNGYATTGARGGMYIVNCNSNASAVTTIYASSQVSSMTASDRILTITPSSAVHLVYLMLRFKTS